MVDQIGPVRPDVAERVALFSPFEGAGRDFKGLFEVSAAVKRLTNALAHIIAHAEMIRIIALVHIDGNDQATCSCGSNDLVSLVDRQTHRLFGDHMDVAFQSSQNNRSMQMIGRGDRHDPKSGKSRKMSSHGASPQ